MEPEQSIDTNRQENDHPADMSPENGLKKIKYERSDKQQVMYYIILFKFISYIVANISPWPYLKL